MIAGTLFEATTLGLTVWSGFSGAYHGFDFGKYAARYLGAIAYRFNRRFDLRALPPRLPIAAVACARRPEPQPQAPCPGIVRS